MTTETLKNPTVYFVPDPVGIDLPIDAMQKKLATIPWLEKSFARAWTIPKDVAGQKRQVPMAYQAGAEYYPLMPNDALKSYSFFQVSNPRSTTEWDISQYGNYRFTDPVSLIVWANLQAIDGGKDYIFKELMIKDVLKLVGREPRWKVTRVWDDKAEDIFRGYTTILEQRDLLMYPYTAFRIECQLTYEFVCP